MTQSPNPETPPGAADPAHPAPPHPMPPAYPDPAAGGPGYPPMPPVSAAPVSAYPTTGYPGYAAYPAPPVRVPTRKGPWLWVLVGVCVVATAGIGALAYLIVAENASSQQAIAEHDAEIEDLESRIRQRESENEGLRDANDGSRSQLDLEQARLADLQECPAAVQAYVDAAISGDEAAFGQAVSRIIDVCDL